MSALEIGESDGGTIDFVLERFTSRARDSIVLARDEARDLGHPYIGTEHLLLGLLRIDEGLAAQVLGSLDVKLDAARASVRTIVGEGDWEVGQKVPFTPRAKKVLELSLREGIRLGQPAIGTEHILLGLVRESDGVAAQVLADLGADGDEIRALVLGARGRSGAFPARALPAMSDGLRTTLDAALDAILVAKKTAKADQDSERVAMIIYAERLLAAMLDPSSTPDSGESEGRNEPKGA